MASEHTDNFASFSDSCRQNYFEATHSLISKTIMFYYNSLLGDHSPLLGYLIVGLCWGVTNPFIKRATATAKVVESNTKSTELMNAKSGSATSKTSTFSHHFNTLKQLVSEPKVFVPFFINQSGSLFYYYMLSNEPVSKAAPICNALTFIFTAITGYIFLKEEIKSPWLLAIGSLLVVAGTYLCFSSSENDR